jgi:hypothetical protein
MSSIKSETINVLSKITMKGMQVTTCRPELDMKSSISSVPLNKSRVSGRQKPNLEMGNGRKHGERPFRGCSRLQNTFPSISNCKILRVWSYLGGGVRFMPSFRRPCGHVTRHSRVVYVTEPDHRSTTLLNWWRCSNSKQCRPRLLQKWTTWQSSKIA